MPRRWLVKTEPESYSYADLARDRRTTWDGVRNPAAQAHLRAMQAGDAVLVYHTGKEKAVVGLARVARAPYPEPGAGDGKDGKGAEAGKEAEGGKSMKAVAVDLEPVRALSTPVTLADLKKERACAGFELVRLPRLSVMPVPDAAWAEIERRSETAGKA